MKKGEDTKQTILECALQLASQVGLRIDDHRDPGR